MVGAVRESYIEMPIHICNMGAWDALFSIGKLDQSLISSFSPQLPSNTDVANLLPCPHSEAAQFFRWQLFHYCELNVCLPWFQIGLYLGSSNVRQKEMDLLLCCPWFACLAWLGSSLISSGMDCKLSSLIRFFSQNSLAYLANQTTFWKIIKEGWPSFFVKINKALFMVAKCL